VTTYITSDEMKNTLEISSETYADADIAVAIESASRVIDAYKGTRFYPTGETRTYTASGCTNSLTIYDLNNSAGSTVSFDMDGDGVYELALVNGTDYYLEPMNANLTGKPWNQITLRQQGGQQWPQFQYGVQVVGSFGWSTAPGQVTEACSILANRYLKRTRETPYGIVTVGTDAMAMARLGKIDPDVAFMLDQIYDSDTPLLIL
jgi:hypothetical protein